MSEMFIFARFHARPGQDAAVADEAAFDLHGRLPHTVRFVERVAPLLDHALDVTRTERIE